MSLGSTNINQLSVMYQKFPFNAIINKITVFFYFHQPATSSGTYNPRDPISRFKKIPRDLGRRTRPRIWTRCVKMRNKLCKPNCKSARGVSTDWLIAVVAEMPRILGWNWNKLVVAWLTQRLIDSTFSDLPPLFLSSTLVFPSPSVSIQRHLVVHPSLHRINRSARACCSNQSDLILIPVALLPSTFPYT